MTFRHSICAVLFLLSSIASAADRPRIGLVLGGGGARGFAHIGILEELERLHVPIDCIAGTSAGSLIGGTYASGLTLDEMKAVFAEQNWDALLSGKSPRQGMSYERKRFDYRNYADVTVGVRNGELRSPRSVINSQPIDLFIRRLTRDASLASFTELPIPFEAIATDLENGNPVIFKSGDLATALRSSMAVPGVFDLMEVNDHLLVDGGMARNLPIENLKGSCADVIIAVDVGTPMLKRDEINSLFDVVAQSTSLAVNQNVLNSKKLLDADDVLITPDLGRYTSADFAEHQAIAAKGREAITTEIQQRLSRFSLSTENYAAWKKRLEKRLAKEVTIDKVVIDGKNLPLMGQYDFQNQLQLQPGQTLNQSQLHQQLQNLFASGDYERLNYFVGDGDGKRVLTVTPAERSVGPNFLRFGIELNSDISQNSTFNLLLNHQRVWLNSWFGEWRNEISLGNRNELRSEFYQPLGPRSHWFVAPYLNYLNEPFNLYGPKQTNVAELEYERYGWGSDLGYLFGRWGEARLGVMREHYHVNQAIGSLLIPEFNSMENSARASLVLDQLDNPRWPKQGFFVSAKYQQALQNAAPYKTLETKLDKAWTYKRVSLRASGRYNVAWADKNDVFHQFPLGGFLNLSGYKNGELLGDRVAFYRLMGTWRLSKLPSALGSGLYAGFSAEQGKVWNNLYNGQNTDWLGAGSLFIGADTLLGPLFFGVGSAEGGEFSGYLFLGVDY